MTPEKQFLHRLALALGKTVGQLVRELTVHELMDWQRFVATHPFPADLIDGHGAMLTALFFNVHREKGAAPARVGDLSFIRSTVRPARPALTMAQRIKAASERREV